MSFFGSSVGGGASFCVLHVDPTEPTGTAPFLDPTARDGSVKSVHLLLHPQVGLEERPGLRTRVGLGPVVPKNGRRHATKRELVAKTIFGRKVVREGLQTCT